ncbi:hypothetical protein [Nonomuraea sp. NPDC005501]|uniref:hypothetical protein n=1 Tax=Nonomuraea sp. NPDC005501 TaxID=3156884 RepID=UPI00339E0CBC
MGDEMRVPPQRADERPGDEHVGGEHVADGRPGGGHWSGERRDPANDHRHGALDDVRGDDDVRAARPEDDDLRMIVDDDRDRDGGRAALGDEPAGGTGDDVLVHSGGDGDGARGGRDGLDHGGIGRDGLDDEDDVPGPNDDGVRREPYATGVSTGPGPAVDEDVAGADGGAAPSHAAPAEIVLFDQDPAEVQARWRELQAGFVDDPNEAVKRADGLVGEVVEALTSALTSRTGELRRRWNDSDGNGGGRTDTEQLRLALREYRTVLERLLALSGGGTTATPGATTASPATTTTPTTTGTR